MSAEAANADVSIRIDGRAGRITLTRPKALNALTHRMVRAIDAALIAWESDPRVERVIIEGDGARAFCAGGDVAEVYHRVRRGDFSGALAFWAEEYRMNARMARYPKPYIAFMHGFVLGGGVGLGGHARHRILGETAQVAMPECGIGLIPDVGGSYLLGRARGHLGEYLGLTGHRMAPGDAIRAGFADRLVPEAAWPALKAALCAGENLAVLAEAAVPAPAAGLAAVAAEIDDAFSAPDLPTLLARLEVTDWGAGVRKILARQSPLSMAATLALVRAVRPGAQPGAGSDPGVGPGLEAALVREYRAVGRCVADGDLMEGVRAQVIDKDRNPQWQDDLDGITAARVAGMLAPLGPGELRFR